jgi:lysophospholipase L1-like esterase
VNARIEALADGEHVRWLNAGARFLDAEGRIPPALMADALHPTPAGYEVWANALRPLVAAALSK